MGADEVKGGLIKVKEAAARLGVHQATLRRFADEGKIHLIRLGQKTWRVDVAELDAFIKKSTVDKARERMRQARRTLPRIADPSSLPPDGSPPLSFAEAAVYFNDMARGVRMLVAKGMLRAAYTEAGEWVVAPRDLRAYAAGERPGPEAQEEYIKHSLPDPEQCFDAMQASKIMGTSDTLVKHFIRTGKLQAGVAGAKRWEIKAADLAAFMREWAHIRSGDALKKRRERLERQKAGQSAAGGLCEENGFI